MQILNCVRCGYEWASRRVVTPKRCARCQARAYNRPARVRKIRPPVGPAGRPRRYPVNVLNVGQQMRLEMPENVVSCKQSIWAYGVRSGRRFEVRATGGGLIVRRVL